MYLNVYIQIVEEKNICIENLLHHITVQQQSVWLLVPAQQHESMCTLRALP